MDTKKLPWFCNLALRFPAITSGVWCQLSKNILQKSLMMPDTSAFFLKRSDLFYTAVMSTCLFKAQDELHILKAWMDAFTV